MKRILKWAVRGMIGVALLALVALLLLVTVVPGWVEGRAVSALEEAGFGGASLEVRHVGLEGATISELRLGEAGRFRVGQLAVDYALTRVVGGEVDTITVTDLSWRVGLREGKVDWAPFSTLEPEEDSAGTTLPFARIVLRAARIRIDWEDEVVPATVDGTVVRVGENRLRVDLAGQLAGCAITAKGTIDLPGGRVDLALTGEAEDLATVLARLPAAVVTVPGEGGGSLRLAGTLRSTVEGFAFALDTEGRGLHWSGDLQGRRIAVRDATLSKGHVEGSIEDGALQLKEVEAALEMPTARLEGLPSLRCEVRARHDGDQGTTLGLSLRDLEGEDARVVGAVEGRGDLDAGREGAFSGTASLSLAADLVASALPELLPLGLDISPEARVTLDAEIGSEAPADGEAPRRVTVRGGAKLMAREVALRPARARMEDLAVHLEAALDVTERGITGRLLSGSHVTARGRADTAEARFAVREGTPALLVLRLGEDAPIAHTFEAEDAWSFSAPWVDLSVSGDARFPGAGLSVDALALDMNLGVSAGAAEWRAHLLTDNDVTWKRLRLEEVASGVSVGQSGFTLPADSNLVKFLPGKDGRTLDARFDLQGDSSFEILADSFGGVAFETWSAKGNFVGPLVAPRLKAELSGSAIPTIAKLGPAAPEVVWEDLLDWKAEVTGTVSTHASSSDPLTLAVEAANRKAQEAVMLRWTDMEIALGALGLKARAVLGAGGAPVVQGRVTLGGTGFLHRPSDVAVDGIAASVPFSFGAPVEGQGKIEAETIWVGDGLVPGLAGGATMDRGLLDLRFDWPVFESVIAKGAGHLRPFDRIPTGRFTLEIPRFAFGPETQPADMLVALGDVVLEGHAAFEGSLRIDGPRVTPDMHLVLEQVSLQSVELEAEAEGIEARITLDGLTPLSTPGGQRIAVGKAKLGKLEVERGEVLFRLEAPDRLLIERTSFGWAGGNLHVEALRFDPFNPDLDLVVYADHLQLGELLEILAEGEATGEGTLYGRLPVRISAEQISYGDFFLYAEPGVGQLQVLDPSGYLSSLPAQARGALRDFDYTVLKLRRSTKDSRGATLRLRGKSRDPAFPREVILDVNLNGFDDLLDGAIMADRIAKGLPGR